MISLYKKIDNKLEVVDLGFPKYKESYEKQGYVIGHDTKSKGISKKIENKFLIHHIHRQQFNLRARLNDLICKLIPNRFLKF
jgi:hypothetical protein